MLAGNSSGSITVDVAAAMEGPFSASSSSGNSCSEPTLGR